MVLRATSILACAEVIYDIAIFRPHLNELRGGSGWSVYFPADTIQTQANSTVNTMQRFSKKDTSDLQSNYVYSKLDKDESEIPWKSILFAFFLLVVGTVFLTCALLLMTGHIDAKHSDRLVPLLTLGTLVFIPGFYYTRIAFLAWRYPGNRQYKFSEIPKWDD